MIQALIQLSHQLVNIAQPQVEGDTSAVKQQSLTAGQGGGPLRLQRRRPRGQFRPVLLRRSQVITG